MGSFFGGGATAPSPPPQSQYDPFGAIGGRQYSAQQYLNYLQNPALAMSSPGYSAQLQAGMGAVTQGAASTGQLMSGGELAQLQNVGQGTFANYYQNALNNLGTASGATTQTPAGASSAQYNAQMQAANFNAQQQQQGWSNLLGLVGMGAGAAIGAPSGFFSNLFGSAPPGGAGTNTMTIDGGVMNPAAYSALNSAGLLGYGPQGYSILGGTR